MKTLFDLRAVALCCISLSAVFHSNYCEVTKTYFDLSEIREYRSYRSLQLWQFRVPQGTTKVTYYWKALRSKPKCPKRHAKVYYQYDGFPLKSFNASSYPPHFDLIRDSHDSIDILTDAKEVEIIHRHPRAGLVYFSAFVVEDISLVIHKFTDQHCNYMIAMIAEAVSEPVPHLPVTNPPTPVTVNMPSGNTNRLFRFFTSKNTWKYNIVVSNCLENGVKVDKCPIELLSSGNTLPDKSVEKTHRSVCNFMVKSCRQTVYSPLVLDWIYVSVNRYKAKPGSNLTFAITVDLTDCPFNLNLSPFESEELDIFCGPIHQLMRREHPGENFIVDFMFNQDRSNVSQNTSKVPDWGVAAQKHKGTFLINFDLVENKDNGGTLQIDTLFNAVALPRNYTGMVRIDICLQRKSLPIHKNEALVCAYAERLVTLTKETPVRSFLVPYPESGPWFLGVRPTCYQPNSTATVACAFRFPPISVYVKTEKCVQNTCGRYGDCGVFVAGSMVFSECRCAAGYRGYGCTDAAKAYSSQQQMAFTLCLVLSNLFFFPAIVVALHRRFYTEACVYACNMFFSTFYHACDVRDWSAYRLCILPYNVLQFSDFFCSIMSFWFTLLALSELKPPILSILHTLGAILLAFAVQYNKLGAWANIAPIITGACVVLLRWILLCHRTRAFYPPKKRWLWLVPGLALALLGIAMFALVETDKNYPYTHSVWHVCMSLSIVFLLPRQKQLPSKCFTGNDDALSDDNVGLIPADSAPDDATNQIL